MISQYGQKRRDQGRVAARQWPRRVWVPPGAAQRLLQEGRGWRAEGAQRAKEGWDGAGVGGAVTAIAPAGCGVREAVCGRLAVGCDGPDAPRN